MMSIQSWIKLSSLVVFILSSCAPARFESSSTVVNEGVLGISPTSVQVSWQKSQTADSYSIIDLNQSSDPVLTTQFTQAVLSNRMPAKENTLSVVGVRGANHRSEPLSLWKFSTWPSFTDVTFSISHDDVSSAMIRWDYDPWSVLAPSEEARTGGEIRCSFVPVAAENLSLAGIDPFASTTDAPVQVMGALVDSQLSLSSGILKSHLAYAGGCEARYVDGTVSRSKNHFRVDQSHQVKACPVSAVIGEAYTCDPRISIGGEATEYILQLESSNTCRWITVSTDQKSLIGNPGAINQGNCMLSYSYTLVETGYTSTVFSANLSVSYAPPFLAFPSFAVRGLSGAVAFPYLYSLAGTGMSRARIKGDLISDFGYSSSFFAGGSEPFPSYSPTPSSRAVSPKSFYGFPVSPQGGGVRPNGYSLDAIRPEYASINPATEGFLRGNLVVPKAMITDGNFLAATGRSMSVSLFSFLTNAYTNDQGATSFPPLSGYLSTVVDFPINGTPITSRWSGRVYERSSVVIKSPSIETIMKYILPTHAQDLAFNARADGVPPAGLATIESGLGSFLKNCQLSPDPLSPYQNPPECDSLPKVFTCFGDIIVQAPLLLVDATILTNQQGCRIYSTSSVFVQGTLAAKDENQNDSFVEISSASAVIFGFSKFSLGVKTDGTGRRATGTQGLLDETFASQSGSPFLTSHHDAPGSTIPALNTIARNAELVALHPINNIYDAGNASNGFFPFSHLAVHAPYVFSNYAGLFSGSIVSEVALFTQLNFTVDSIFKGAPFFPLYSDQDRPIYISDH